jgi:hypothetical protein
MGIRGFYSTSTNTSSPAAASPKRTVIVDIVPLKTVTDQGDDGHAWAVRALRKLVARMDIVAVPAHSPSTQPSSSSRAANLPLLLNIQPPQWF